MAKILDQPRYKCALAAMQTVHAITGAIPVLHSGPGCAAKLNDNNGTSGRFSPNIFPCSSVSEKEVVFGGTGKLRSTIENALKVIDADLFVVLSGCTSEIIGDDIEEVAGNFSGEKKPVLWAKTPGFKGNNYLGHDWILKSIFEQYLERDEVVSSYSNADGEVVKEKGLVNLFVSPPQQDPYWLGNLREIEALLSAIGLKPNTIFGFGRGIENIKKIPQAEYTILVSPWTGLESAKYLERRFGIKLLQYPVLPIGATETSKFLRAVQEFTGADKELTEKVIAEKEAEFYYYIERFADTLLETRILGKRFAVASDSEYSIAVTKFLVNDMGLFPEKVFITDDAPKSFQQKITDEVNNLNYGIKTPVQFTTDGHDIHEQIKAADFAGTPLIIGSNWEKKLAAELGAHFVNVSYPMLEKLVINDHIAGYSGGLHLLEQIFTAAMSKLKL
ncbi:MAG: hydrogenase [Treponema sp.]|nr:hydrogenase [Treponema sp.]MBQ1670858.1 hydrogenase [Treponema sp.]MBQ4025004.1 hydrogenase [Treponema sp.]MBR4246372.1 hydrogenase [Treponema sp.]